MKTKQPQRRLKLGIDECRVIRDWFMYVDPTQRTSVDSRLNHKISERVSLIEKSPKMKSVYLDTREVQLATRWFLFLDDIICDNSDKEAYQTMEDFLEK